MRGTRGLIVACSSEGRILEVLRDAMGRVSRGELLSDLVCEGDRAKCARFFDMLAAEGAVFGWELHIGEAPLVFAGFLTVGLCIVLGAEEPALIERLHQELMSMNSELTNSLRDAEKQHAITRRGLGLSFDDFARMSNELAALHREITKRARELEQINRDYERRQAEMAALEVRREQFLQYLVHDLRSPLTSVKGAVTMALAGHLGPIDETAREVLTLAKEGCDRLTEMVATILDTAKAEAKQLDLSVESVPADDLVEMVIRELKNRASDSNVSLRADVDPDISLLADRGMIHRVLANYVVNAIKFTPPEKTVTISVRVSGALVRVSVRDEGPGIPEAQREQLFKKYGQIERRGMSTGLGLHFCIEMVRAMKGSVGVDNNEVGGATFWFELPRAGAG